VVPLEDLVQHDSVEEAAEAEAQHEGRGPGYLRTQHHALLFLS